MKYFQNCIKHKKKANEQNIKIVGKADIKRDLPIDNSQQTNAFGVEFKFSDKNLRKEFLVKS